MTDQIPTKSMVEGAFLAAITAVLFIISIYIPLLGTLVSFLCPLPIIILCLRHSIKFAIISAFISGILVTILAGPLQGLIVLLGFGILGLTLGFGIKKGLSLTDIIIIGSIASLISKGLILLIGFWVLDLNTVLFDIEEIDKIITQSLNFYSNMGLSPEQLATLKDSLTQTISIVRIAFPGMIILASIFDTILNYWVTRLILKRFGYKLANFSPFHKWRASKSFFWSYFLGMILIILGTVYKVPLLNRIGINIQVFFTVVFLIYGLSLTSFILERFKIKNFLRWVVYILVCFQPLLSQIVTWAAMLDIWIDFRRLITARKE
ncbi:YybS family protein [bacterium]|nr:YybS family protein [bacterium]MBU4601833.1 YybS family protein [bacterium]MCG2761801.1 YybS family protein [Candidatus Atribacteria bacterium]